MTLTWGQHCLTVARAVDVPGFIKSHRNGAIILPSRRVRAIPMSKQHEPSAESLADPTIAERPSARARSSDRAPASSPPGAALSGLRPRSASEPRAVTSVGSGDTDLDRAMLVDEQTRAHGFAAAIAVISASMLVASPWLDGDPTRKLAFQGAIAVSAAISAWVFRKTRAPQPYDRLVLRIYACAIALVAVFAAQYIGVFSPMVVLLALGTYWLGQSSDPVQSAIVPGVVIATYAAQTVLLTFGLMPDLGLFSARDATFSTHLLGIAAGAGVLLLTHNLARIARSSMRETIARANEAALLAQQREALLVEAQQHLERALDVAVGKPGHYTGKVAGEYLLDVIIGIGAMGAVYAGEHVQSGERVAVKLPHPSVEQRPELVERFLREGQICQTFDSPFMVRVHAVGRIDTGAPFLAMELLEGTDLAALLRKEGRLSLPVAAELARAMAEGLHHAHGAGVVHRDLKPVNVFRAHGAHGRVQWKILDFGISKLSTGKGTLTHQGVVGTPGYMSPEQARGLPVDHRSDVFSMAVVLYRAITGRPAFSGSDTPQIMFEVVYKTPERPSAIVKDLPREVDLVLAIALAKDPKVRFQSARELAQALDAVAAGTLDRELEARGRAAVKRYPWGQPVPQ
jgi:eukaryotic-like serine/threonine-protein kinase